MRVCDYVGKEKARCHVQVGINQPILMFPLILVLDPVLVKGLR
jgi:hypothetical protein